MSRYGKKLADIKKITSYFIKVKKYGPIAIRLRVINQKDVDNKYLIDKLSLWRRENFLWFPRDFKVTNSRTKKWLKDLVVANPDRILFSIEDLEGKIYGHMGFYRFNEKNNSCELDNVVRGENDVPGLMTDCVKRLTAWGFKNLGVESIRLSTFADNQRAINLYKRCGFKKAGRIPLVRIEDKEPYWEKMPKESKIRPERYYQKMVLSNGKG